PRFAARVLVQTWFPIAESLRFGVLPAAGETVVKVEPAVAEDPAESARSIKTTGSLAHQVERAQMDCPGRRGCAVEWHLLTRFHSHSCSSSRPAVLIPRVRRNVLLVDDRVEHASARSTPDRRAAGAPGGKTDSASSMVLTTSSHPSCSAALMPTNDWPRRRTSAAARSWQKGFGKSRNKQPIAIRESASSTVRGRHAVAASRTARGGPPPGSNPDS